MRNRATESSFISPDGAALRVSFSGGVFAVHTDSNPFYSIGAPAAQNGFEAFAEDADPGPLIDAVQFDERISLLGVANRTQGPDGGGVFLLPGDSYRIIVSAPGQNSRLTLALHFTISNDLFVGTDSQGISLFDSAGNPLSGDITGLFTLLDAGTEVNEAPGSGPNQFPLQEGPNQGEIEGGLVRPVDDGFVYPQVPEVLEVTIRPLGEFE